MVSSQVSSTLTQGWGGEEGVHTARYGDSYLEIHYPTSFMWLTFPSLEKIST